MNYSKIPPNDSGVPPSLRFMSARELDDGGPVAPGLMEQGLSLRDYFAAQVAAFYLTHHGWGCYALAAESAYKLADAMLDERAKGDTP